MKKRESLREILMKVLTRQLKLESDLRVLWIALRQKGILSIEDFSEAEVIAKQVEEELLKLDRASPEELLAEALRKFQGPKQ